MVGGLVGSILHRLKVALGRAEPPPCAGPDGLSIRAMTPRDVAGVAAIEGASFGSPWRAGSYTRAVQESPQQFFVAELEGRLVGYAGFWVERTRAHIAKVAVEADSRRRGIGGALLEHVLDQVRRLGLGSAYLEVRKSNKGAQELYRRFGFRFERVQPHAYPNDGEDAYVLVLDGLLEVAPPSAATKGTEE